MKYWPMLPVKSLVLQGHTVFSHPQSGANVNPSGKTVFLLNILVSEK